MRALRGLEDDRASVRLRAALAVGSTPDPRFVGALVERCAVEPESLLHDEDRAVALTAAYVLQLRDVG